VPVEEQYGGYGILWDIGAVTVTRATARLAEAEAKVAAINAKLDSLAAEHPEWQGLSVAVAFYWTDQPGGYRSNDVRPQLLAPGLSHA
jgi:iron complex transport system substrate-binding protein